MLFVSRTSIPMEMCPILFVMHSSLRGTQSVFCFHRYHWFTRSYQVFLEFFPIARFQRFDSVLHWLLINLKSWRLKMLFSSPTFSVLASSTEFSSCCRLFRVRVWGRRRLVSGIFLPFFFSIFVRLVRNWVLGLRLAGAKRGNVDRSAEQPPLRRNLINSTRIRRYVSIEQIRSLIIDRRLHRTRWRRCDGSLRALRHYNGVILSTPS